MRDKYISDSWLPVETLGNKADEILVAMAQEGQERAYTELCSRHSKMAKIIIGRILRNKEDTEDVLQESVLKVYLHLKSFDGSSKFSTWFTRVAINSALGLLRKRKSRCSELIDSHSDATIPSWASVADKRGSPEQMVVRAELVHKLRHAISTLPPTLQAVIELRHSELSIKEIAEQSGLSVAATKTRLFRARKELASRLKPSHTRDLNRSGIAEQEGSLSLVSASERLPF